MFKNRQVSTPEAVERRVECKRAELAALDAQLAALESEVCLLTDEDVDVVVKRHIRQLKAYNELKDSAMSLMAMIADQRQIRLGDVMREIGVVDDK